MHGRKIFVSYLVTTVVIICTHAATTARLYTIIRIKFLCNNIFKQHIIYSLLQVNYLNFITLQKTNNF